ncbi:MAG: F0F1 ATP synthase subunit delta [Gammaproteobacteria bacterium]|nr:MAG: F0F1 ATP synthase subunit delta [Gammaproteobacteria bacterium]
MAEQSTLARPYAQAIFDLARSNNELQLWSDMLQLVSVITADEQLQLLLDNPSVSGDRLQDLIIGVADAANGGLTEAGRNMVKVLRANNRLGLVAEVARQFEVLKAKAENTLHADVISAMPISDAQQQKLAEALKNRLGRDVELNCSIDESLIGGAIIRAGDLVIDGSARGRLEKLSTILQ